MADEPSNNSPRSSPSDDDMALVANPQALLQSGINKRYRPAPAKTFQCRGYGECRMVFSRSEHLARHIRKHTGERPFTCHCGKQFSRLDNLRQHAQTVHADKLDQNEQMMRDLTSLHATMAASTKTPTGPRKRNGNAQHSPQQEDIPIKQEDHNEAFRGRPGTTAGYEGDHNGIIYQGGTNWHLPPSSSDMHRRPSSHSFRDDAQSAQSFRESAQSFRDPTQSFRDPSQSFRGHSSSGQSFRGPSAYAGAPTHTQPPSPPTANASSQSFLGFSHTFNFGAEPQLRDDDGRRRSLCGSADERPGAPPGSRPPTAGGDAGRTLPPLAAVVSAAGGGGGYILPLPGFRRPGTATRPGTAPASSYAYFGKPPGSGVGSRSGELHHLAPPGVSASDQFDDASPFSFHPPAEPLASPPAHNPRKRPYPGGDGESDVRPQSASRRWPGEEYEYGSESRPASRRLSVMELCNDAPADADARADRVLHSSAGAGSRPGTSAGAGLLLSALALVDTGHGQLRARAAHPAANAAPPHAGGGAPPGRGGRVPREPGRAPVSPVSSAARSSPISPLSSEPPVSPLVPAAVFRGHAYGPSAAVPDAPFAGQRAGDAFADRDGRVPSPADGGALPRRAGAGEPGHDQVRVAVGAPQSPAALGMRA
ncbi:hypothetical protein HWV62_10208 [Athelia sp. TMB]|nr:hypothetical protein HWV62_10208 [Athelia sp. TMB]